MCVCLCVCVCVCVCVCRCVLHDGSVWIHLMICMDHLIRPEHMEDVLSPVET